MTDRPYGHHRINMHMDGKAIVVALTGGNPGGMMVCAGIVAQTPRIDPDHALQGLGYLLLLDTLAIHDDLIWLLWKDICGENMINLLAVLRATSLGILAEADLKMALQGARTGAMVVRIDVAAALKAVCERLPRFGQ